MTASDLLPLLVVFLLGGLSLLPWAKRFSAWEMYLIGLSFALHALSAFAQIWIIRNLYGGVGDMLAYQRFGLDISAALRTDFGGVAPEVLKLLFQADFKLNVFAGYGADSTGSMVALTGIMNFLLGNSFYAVSVAFALASAHGKVLMYQAFRQTLERRYRLRILCAIMLVPSVVFWSGGVIKEAVAVAGLGLVVLGVVNWVGRRSNRSLVWVALGALVVSLVKPHLLFAVAFASGVYLYWQRAQGRGGVEIRPIYLLGALVLGFGALIVLGELFPKYSLSSIGDRMAQMQFYGQRGKGGSTYSVGDPNTRSLLGQLAFAPLGLFTGLYRPLIVEARNPQMVVNGLETLALLYLTGLAFFRRAPRALWQHVNPRPGLVFCLVLAVTLGAMTGLVSQNLGTLSRYRMPLMPFFALFLVVASAPAAKVSRSARASRRRPPEAGAAGRPRRVAVARGLASDQAL